MGHARCSVFPGRRLFPYRADRESIVIIGSKVQIYSLFSIFPRLFPKERSAGRTVRWALGNGVRSGRKRIFVRCFPEQGAGSGHSLCGGRMEDVKEVRRFRCVEWQTEVREEGGGLCRRMYRGSENKIPLPHICSKGVFIFIYRSGAAGRFRDADDPIRLLRYSASRNLF